VDVIKSLANSAVRASPVLGGQQFRPRANAVAPRLVEFHVAMNLPLNRRSTNCYRDRWRIQKKVSGRGSKPHCIFIFSNPHFAIQPLVIQPMERPRHRLIFYVRENVKIVGYTLIYNLLLQLLGSPYPCLYPLGSARRTASTVKSWIAG